MGFSIFYLGAVYGHIMDALMTGNCSSGTGAPLYIDITILDTDSAPDSPEENCFRELILLSLILAKELFKD
ncbi:hypothetical protein [Methanothermobacter sp. DP]|uniref:hypothetical protein n=1 Tax=Methanothermobacter sp. DP TaxID=2998972 RepID=UPI0039E14327